MSLMKRAQRHHWFTQRPIGNPRNNRFNPDCSSPAPLTCFQQWSKAESWQLESDRQLGSKSGSMGNREMNASISDPTCRLCLHSDLMPTAARANQGWLEWLLRMARKFAETTQSFKQQTQWMPS
jgi:hypothetical protein